MVRGVIAVGVLAVGLTSTSWAIHVSAQRAGGTSEPQTPPAAGDGRQSGGAPAGGRQGGGGGQGGDFWPGLHHLLAVADVQSGYHHDSISHALATVEQIGRRTLPAVSLCWMV